MNYFIRIALDSKSILDRIYHAISNAIVALLHKPAETWTLHDLLYFLFNIFIGLVILSVLFAIIFGVVALLRRTSRSLRSLIRKILRIEDKRKF